MIERGVRFVNIYHEGWDAHSDVAGNLKTNCGATDQASAALVMDLKERGLLDDTLVIWGGEFGRTPMVESNVALGRSLGRDHHPQAFTMWLAGGGIKPGTTYRRDRRPGLSHRQGPCPRPRPAGHDLALARLRPRKAHVPPRRPRLPAHRRAWEGDQGNPGLNSSQCAVKCRRTQIVAIEAGYNRAGRSIVEAHGGTITVASVFDRGPRFTVAIPRGNATKDSDR